MSSRPPNEILNDFNEGRFFLTEEHMQADAPIHLEEIDQFVDKEIDEAKPLRRFKITIEEIDENGIPGRGKQPVARIKCTHGINLDESECPDCDEKYSEIFERREERLEAFKEETKV